MNIPDITSDAATLAIWVAFGIGVFAVLAEAWHGRRTRRVARLAFGPLGKARAWTRLAPAVRVLALTAMAWGLVTLFFIRPRVASYDKIPEGGYRHLVIAWDVSPSMQLDDGGFDSGKQKKRTRAQRGAKVLLSLFDRIALDQVRISIVAFFTGAKPVVVDTHDLNVVKNILDDLPLDMAFDPGKTSLIDGIEESVRLAKEWEPGSATLLIVSDGDTVPDTGLPRLPPSINRVLVAGVGDSRRGVFIDGHMSRQNSRVLRQLAKRLGGEYVDVNDVQIPTTQLAELAGVRNLVDSGDKGRRELALGCVATGTGLLALLPVGLALFGSAWQSGRSCRAKKS
ncbi:MAG TPA: hypothetical protein QGH16_06155 [Verrucomicrobiota bacterium]|jgi:Ca-activated chloride channel family protein|nr:hypothetical protein [Verrucomicrobiota bacterium]